MVGNFILRVPVETGDWLFLQVSVSLLSLVLHSQILLWSNRFLRNLLDCSFINCTLAFHQVKLKFVTTLTMLLCFWVFFPLNNWAAQFLCYFFTFKINELILRKNNCLHFFVDFSNFSPTFFSCYEHPSWGEVIHIYLPAVYKAIEKHVVDFSIAVDLEASLNIFKKKKN